MNEAPRLTYIEGYLLDAGPNWWKYTGDERKNIINGVGPDAWPAGARCALDRLPFLLPASWPHDIDFHAGGTDEDRRAADLRFRDNCFRAAERYFDCGFWRGFVKGCGIRWTMAAGWITLAYVALSAGSSKHWTYRDAQK
jgi:hypothetical protein